MNNLTTENAHAIALNVVSSWADDCLALGWELGWENENFRTPLGAARALVGTPGHGEEEVCELAAVEVAETLFGVQYRDEDGYPTDEYQQALDIEAR